MKPPSPATKEKSLLVSFLQNPTTTQDSAVDALVEFIMARRRKGWSIYEVTLGLIEVMQKVSTDDSPESGRGERDEPKLIYEFMVDDYAIAGAANPGRIVRYGSFPYFPPTPYRPDPSFPLDELGPLSIA